MALTLKGWRLTITVNDERRSTSTIQHDILPDGSDTQPTLAQAQAKRTAVLAALANMTNAAVLSHSLAEVYEETSVSLPAGSEVEEKAVLTAQLANSVNLGTIVVPSPVATIFVNDGVGSGGNVIDIADAAVVAYAALFRRVDANSFPLAISDGQYITSVTKGARTYRRRKYKAF